MGLEFVNHDEQITGGIQVMVYGRPGSGKTTAAATAPGPVLIVNADRPHATAAARLMHGKDKIHELAFAGAKTLDEVYLHFKDGNAPEKTVVLDTIGGIYQKLLIEIAGAKATAIPSIDHYLEAQNRIYRWLLNMQPLGVNIVLICHEEVDDSEVNKMVQPLTGGRQLPKMLMGEMDVIAYATVIEASGDTPPQYVAQTVEGGGRRAKPGPANLGPVVPLDIGAWVAETSAALNGQKIATNTQTPKEKAAA